MLSSVRRVFASLYNDRAIAYRVHQGYSHADLALSAGVRDFASPLAIHDRVLPGIPEMTRLKALIHYSFEETDRGGKVWITTLDPQALGAVHSFLRAQIGDHRTGDPKEPPSRR